MSLRTRLLVLVLLVVAAGLIVSDVATVVLLQRSLLQRIDTQLTSATVLARGRLGREDPPPDRPRRRAGPGALRQPPPARRGAAERIGADVRVARIAADGSVVAALAGPFAGTNDPFRAIRAADLAAARSGSEHRFSARLAGVDYRALAVPTATDDVVVALIPLTETRSTVRRVIAIEVAVTVALLGATAAVSSRLVRVSLRPLSAMADTADAIARGEVDRRIEGDGGVEVARLGDALNKAFDARRVSESKLRTFVADASHELRTPLTSIRGYAELLRSGAVSGRAKRAEALRRIESEATRMGGLVDDLLTLARVDEGRPLRRDAVDLTVLAGEAVADASAVEPERPIRLVAPSPVVVRGDEPRLRQIVVNLLANAIEHTPGGTPVEVRVTAGDGLARIDVIDDGPGVPPDLAPHVFGRFWRGDAAHGHRADRESGTGLGLAIVEGLSKAHGGTASLEPSERGAHFVVTLPLSG